MASPAGSDLALVGGGSRRIWGLLADGFPSAVLGVGSARACSHALWPMGAA